MLEVGGRSGAFLDEATLMGSARVPNLELSKRLSVGAGSRCCSPTMVSSSRPCSPVAVARGVCSPDYPALPKAADAAKARLGMDLLSCYLGFHKLEVRRSVSRRRSSPENCSFCPAGPSRRRSSSPPPVAFRQPSMPPPVCRQPSMQVQCVPASARRASPRAVHRQVSRMQSENGGVVGMLEVIESDFARLESESGWRGPPPPVRSVSRAQIRRSMPSQPTPSGMVKPMPKRASCGHEALQQAMHASENLGEAAPFASGLPAAPILHASASANIPMIVGAGALSEAASSHYAHVRKAPASVGAPVGAPNETWQSASCQVSGIRTLTRAASGPNVHLSAPSQRTSPARSPALPPRPQKSQLPTSPEMSQDRAQKCPINPEMSQHGSVGEDTALAVKMACPTISGEQSLGPLPRRSVRASGTQTTLRMQGTSTPSAPSTNAQEATSSPVKWNVASPKKKVATRGIVSTPVEKSTAGACSSCAEARPTVSATHAEVAPNKELSDGVEEQPGVLARKTVDEARAQSICNATLDDIARYPDPPDFKRECLGTWMVWMVHRVSLNDPSIKELDFRRCSMPGSLEEPRIAPKLLQALASNTHLRVLKLVDANLAGEDQARELAKSLQVNRTLEVLNLESNCFTPSDLKVIFSSLAHNTAMKEIRLQAQFCEEQEEADVPSSETVSLLAAVNETMRTNNTLQKLGLDLVERHYRDQITKALIRNTEVTRRTRSLSRGTSKGKIAQEHHRRAQFESVYPQNGGGA